MYSAQARVLSHTTGKVEGNRAVLGWLKDATMHGVSDRNARTCFWYVLLGVLLLFGASRIRRRPDGSMHVRWHLRKWQIGRLQEQAHILGIPTVLATVSGYHIGLCDLFRVNTELDPQQLATLGTNSGIDLRD